MSSSIPSSAPTPRPGTAVVTGATSGLGLAVAEELTRQGYEVVVVGRDPLRCAAARGRLSLLQGRELPPAVVADLSIVAEVRRAAEEIRARHPAIGLLVNNAGAVFPGRELTAEGHERTFALNVLAPFLLSELLQPALRAAGGGARVVNVASAAHRGARLDVEEVDSRRGPRGFGAYGASKLALLLLTYAAARRVPGPAIAFLAVHPGFLRTGFGRNLGGGFGAAVRIAMVFALPVRRGAETVLYAATSPELEGVTGKYIARSRVVDSSAASLDRATGEQLWAVAGRLTEP